MPIFSVPITALRNHINPMDGKMWKCRPISEQEITNAIRAGAEELRTWDQVINTMGEDESRNFHINRIATLVVQPSSERIVVIVKNHLTPIEVHLYDGNHRIAAAYVRGDERIDAVLACSISGHESEVFPGAIPLRSNDGKRCCSLEA
jgi:hypothetical protein